MILRNIFDKHKCDKGSDKHYYDRCYEAEFEHMRELPLNILEIGVLKGASIASWVEYFPNATIYCMDIFERVPVSKVDILNHPRVKWLNADSTADDCSDKIKAEFGEDIKFDIIIDDGAHWLPAINATFLNIMPFLKQDGAYYMEDLFNMSFPAVRDHWFILKNPHRFSIDAWDKLMYNVSKFTTTHFDYTESPMDDHGANLDGYIIKVTYD